MEKQMSVKSQGSDAHGMHTAAAAIKAEEARNRRIQTLNEASQQFRRSQSDAGSRKSGGGMYPILELNRSTEPKTIHEAAERGNNLAIEKFLAQGNTVDTKDYLGRTPLMYAVENNNLGTVDFLLQRGAVLSIMENSSGRNVVHLAARAGVSDILNVLLNHMSAYVKSKLLNQPDNKGITPIYLAYSMGQQTQECYEILLREGATFDQLQTGRPSEPPPIIPPADVDMAQVRTMIARSQSGGMSQSESGGAAGTPTRASAPIMEDEVLQLGGGGEEGLGLGATPQ